MQERHPPNQSILWRCLHLPGHEFCRLTSENGIWRLAGSAAISHKHAPCRLDYVVVCDPSWNTVSAKVNGWVANRMVETEIAVNPDHRWLLNGIEQPQVAGCIDVDLNFSPSTNLLPIRRLQLRAGEDARVNAAWLRFPSFELERLSQVYRRFNESTYKYESSTGFVAELQVNEAGFVTNYAGLWELEKGGLEKGEWVKGDWKRGNG